MCEAGHEMSGAESTTGMQAARLLKDFQIRLANLKGLASKFPRQREIQTKTFSRRVFPAVADALPKRLHLYALVGREL